MTRDEATDCRYLLGAMLLGCLTMGGGTVRGLAIDALLQIFIICAATFTILKLRRQPVSWIGLALFALVFCAGLVQIVPLPVRLFSELRQEVFLPHMFTSGVEDTFSTISLATSRTISATLSALCGIYLFVALSKLSERQLIGLMPFYAAGLVINLMVLYANHASGHAYDTSGLIGYEADSGLFANSNHLSTLLCSSIPLLIFVGMHSRHGYFCNLVLFFILASLLAVGSRAGILIGLAVLTQSVVLLNWRTRVGCLVALGLLVASSVYGYGAYARIGGDELEATLGRRDFLLTTLRGIGDNWLLGTGYGSFDLIYPHYERLEDVYSPYVNHAHNDFLEIVLEGGVVGAFIVALYLGLLVARLPAMGDRSLQRLSFLSICVVLVHSSVDYPLRTTAIATAFAFFNALFFATGSAPSVPRSGVIRSRRAGVHGRAEANPSPH